AAVQPLHYHSKRLLALSTPEREVVRCLMEGLTNSEISRILAINLPTVKNYLFKIFDKLGVYNRGELGLSFCCSCDWGLRAASREPKRGPPRDNNTTAQLHV